MIDDHMFFDDPVATKEVKNINANEFGIHFSLNELFTMSTASLFFSAECSTRMAEIPVFTMIPRLRAASLFKISCCWCGMGKQRRAGFVQASGRVPEDEQGGGEGSTKKNHAPLSGPPGARPTPLPALPTVGNVPNKPLVLFDGNIAFDSAIERIIGVITR